MTIYIIIILLINFGIYTYDIKRKKGKKSYYIFLLLVLISLAAFRYEVGADTVRYMRGFNNLLVGESMDSVEMGDKFQPLAVLIFGGTKLFGGEFWIIQLIYAIIFNCTIFWFINKYSQNIFCCLLIYFLFFYPKLNFEILRESLAIVFFMIGFVNLEKKKYWIYGLCCIGAFLSHISGIFMIFFLIIRKLPNTPTYLCAYIGLSLLLSFVSDKIVSAFIGIGNVEDWVGYQSSIMGKIGILIKAVLFPLLVYHIAKHRNVSTPILNAIKLYPFIACAELVIFILFRFENYMAPFMIIGLAGILFSLFSKIRITQFANAIIIGLFAIFVYTLPYFTSISKSQYIPYYEFWIPYYSILDQNKDTQRTNMISLYGR